MYRLASRCLVVFTSVLAKLSAVVSTVGLSIVSMCHAHPTWPGCPQLPAATLHTVLTPRTDTVSTTSNTQCETLHQAKIVLIDTDIDWSIIELWEMFARFSPSALLTGWYLILLSHFTLLRWEANNPPHSIPPDVLLCLRELRVLSSVVMKCQVSELLICYPQLKCSTLHVAACHCMSLHVAACRHITGIMS